MGIVVDVSRVNTKVIYFLNFEIYYQSLENHQQSHNSRFYNLTKNKYVFSNTSHFISVGNRVEVKI